MKRWIILYYTNEPHPPDVFEELQLLLNRVIELTKRKAKFSVYEVGPCIGDYS
jgi:hypothetical protein